MITGARLEVWLESPLKQFSSDKKAKEFNELRSVFEDIFEILAVTTIKL
jgi:hypothetical protein